MKVTSTGFSTFEAKDIAIAANNIVRVDAALKSATYRSHHRRRRSRAAADRQVGSPHRHRDAKKLTQIPIAGYRNFQSLMDFVPGAMPANFQNASTDSPARALTTNVNGASRNSNNTRIDGAASVMTWLPHHSFYVPPLESIEAVNISTNNFDAEQGMAGGAAVSVITKSGTNALPRRRHSGITPITSGARRICSSIPTRRPGPDTPQRIDNQYGGTFGGPIVKDKLFFFTPGKARPRPSAATAC